MENENPKYSFDTSAFIDSWKRYYPIDLFPSVWKFIAEKIKDNSIKSTILVKKELERQKDNLWEYITQFNNLFQDVSGKQSQIVQQILNHPDFDKWGKSSAHEADPFVVALASYTNSTVVSYENPRKTKNTIPAACRFFKMNHFSFIEFLRNEKYKMG